MKFKKATATGLLLLGLGNVSWAVAPCVERPTPPPCCADGRCGVPTEPFGVYPTRWRKWPVEYTESMTAGQVAPGTQQPDSSEYPRFELPSAEEEDRKAPPPTTPREEPLKSSTTNTAPAGEGGAQQGRPQTPPQGQPSEKPEPTGPRRTLPPYEPTGPGPKPLNMLNNQQGKSGEADPPPAPPFGPQRFEEGTPVRQASYTPATSARRAVRPAVNISSDDPPPGLPGTLGASVN